MCGICGIIETNGKPVMQADVQRMITAIRHRGPDGDGSFADGAVGFGHCRLAILDLTSKAAQPMHTEDGLFCITYSGQIYNHATIRDDLIRLGHRFRTRTDTEVVLKAYAQWGKMCVERFNGMFAFAVIDHKRQQLFLARDRYGIKPLYYTFCGETLLFASESKAFISFPAFRPELDMQALTEYFTFQNILSEKTLFNNVSVFPAGCHAYMSLRGEQTIHFTPYWDYNFVEDPSLNNEEACQEELDHLLQQAIKRQLVADVEIGSYLSGGMDSGSITAIATQQIPNIKTFTCGFDLHSASGLELSFDERNAAEFMSYLFKTEQYEMVLKAGDMERVLSKVTWHIDEPRMGQSYPNYCIAKLASRFVKVAMAGTGGDELFGGYPWRYYRTLGAKNYEEYIDKYYTFWQRLVPNTTLKDMLRPVGHETRDIKTRDIFSNIFADKKMPNTLESSINNSLYFEAKTFLRGLLIVEDKLSMAHGLETRVPFLDNDLVDFAMRLPVRMKLRTLDSVLRVNENETNKLKNHFLKTNDGKYLLRKAMKKYIPESVTDAMKQGFSAPDASWFKGDSIQYVQRILYSDKARLYNYLDKNTVQGLVTEHLTGKTNRRLLIWSLLTFESWLESFLP